MKITVNEDFVQKAHEDAARRGAEVGAGSMFQTMAARYVDGHWRRFISRLERFSSPLKGGTFVDYGCKFGHLTPLLVDQGVEKVYAVDVMEEYLTDGQAVFGTTYPVQYVRSENCFVNIPSDSADFILTNEVISHINPAFLDVYYSEVARVLKPGGELIISDGNNWMNLETRLDLLEWYQAWEEGSSKEFGESNYVVQRRKVIEAFDPSLPDEDVEHIARNTSGLWGDQIAKAIEDFKAGRLVKRPYRPGICPTHPALGVMMEKAFDPTQVIRALEMYGMSAKQVLRGVERDDLRMIGATKNFTIRARKLPADVGALQDFARAALASDDHQFTAMDMENIGAATLLEEVIRNYRTTKRTDSAFERALQQKRKTLCKDLSELLKQARRDRRDAAIAKLEEVRDRLKQAPQNHRGGAIAKITEVYGRLTKK
jgi:SAM-dependent methyltransferase